MLIYESRAWAGGLQGSGAVAASAKVVRVFGLSPALMWLTHEPRLGIDRAGFRAYFAGREMAWGMEIEAVDAFAEPVPLPGASPARSSSGARRCAGNRPARRGVG